jgi:kojibiose phosphorylase
MARDLYTGFDERTGLFEQFPGYFGLEDIDLSAYVPRTAPIDVVLGKRIQGSKIIKQPDVVMLIYLLWDRMPPEVRKANFEYYEPRCGHGTSLSPAIHALVAARLGDSALAQRYFRQAAEVDLADNMGNAAGGVHLGALGGLWQAAVFGFAGLHFCGGETPRPRPNLPAGWRSLAMHFQWRGQWHELTVPEGAEDRKTESET